MKTWFVEVIIPFVDKTEKYETEDKECFAIIVNAITEKSAKAKAIAEAINQFGDDDDCCQVIKSKISIDVIYKTSDDARL